MIKENQIFSEGQIGSLKSQPKEELDFEITKYHKCGGELYWYGCYEGDGYYKQYFEPSTYAHPAKISPLLAERIFKHLEQLGLLKEGMTILDFMAGSGRVPLLASLRGYKSIGVELENHFTKMCEDNKKFAENKIGRKLDMTTIQGDSRQLSKLLKSSDVAVLSPPYGLGEGIGHSYKTPSKMLTEMDMAFKDKYGNSEGNIGNLPYKDIVAVVSPPFEQQTPLQDKNFFQENAEYLSKKWGRNSPESIKRRNAGFYIGNYGNNPSNIGNLKYKEMVGIVSPPFLESLSSNDKKFLNRVNEDIKLGKTKGHGTIGKQIFTAGEYSQNPQNIGNLKDKEFVGITSPPYMHDSVVHIGEKENREEWIKKKFNNIPYSDETIDFESRRDEKTGQFNAHEFENIGRQHSENYLEAMLQVYKEASKVCPVICTITKNPTRQGKLRRLDLDTAKLLELSGYRIIDYHRAVLFKTFEQQTLTGSTKKEYKGRLSFFKRLSLQKGNTASEWEDIIIGIKNV